MFDVVLKVSKSMQEDTIDNFFNVIEKGIVQSFPNLPDGIVAIPEDYYLTLDVSYVFDDGREIFNKTPKITIDNDNFYCHPVNGEDGRTHWILNWLHDKTSPHRGRPFWGLAGVHEIKISAFEDSEEYTENIVCVEILANKERADEIHKMLHNIDDNYDEITNMCISKNSYNSSLLELIEQAEDIVTWLNINWNTLLSQLRKTLEPCLIIKPNGLPNSPESLHWICSNPEALGFCLPEEQDFKVNNFPVKTDYCAEEVVKPQYNLYENNVIAAFFEHVQTKISDIKKFIHANMNKQSDKNEMYPGYIRYKQIVNKYNINLLSGYEDTLNKLQDNIFKFYNKFKQVTGIRYSRHLMPKITPFVARTNIYYNFYQIINKWYEKSRAKITLNDFAMHFIKIDKLYEFSVLTKIVNAVNSLGGHNTKMSWHNMKTRIFGGVESERPDNEPFNYYKWLSSSREFTIELWYEPRISTVDYATDGELVVVHSDNYHREYTLTPDFIFRIEWSNTHDVDYIIMDAKYSSDNTVLNQSLPRLINKYLYSLNIKSKKFYSNPVRAVWAIYSRGQRKSISWYVNSHNLQSDYMVFPSLEGIQICADDDSVFKDSLNSLINGLRQLHSKKE
ncbi:MAG: hypothetical protein ACI4V7_07235 [Succinivibrionaceae bacterium]